MRQLAGMLILASLVGGAWYLVENYDLSGLENLSLRPRNGSDSPHFTDAWWEGRNQPGKGIRVVSLQCPALDPTHPEFQTQLPSVAELLRRFDLVSLHGMRHADEILLSLLLEKLNVRGRSYDYFLGPPVGPDADQRRFAFLFDTNTVEIDRLRSAPVKDPGNLFAVTPLVGWFRTRGVPADQAFTFGIVLVALDAWAWSREMASLAPLYRTVREHHRGEDDLILLGDLGSPADARRALASIRGLRQVIPVTATMYLPDDREQMFVPLPGTSEFTGRAAYVDLVREMNITTEQARKLAVKTPIWGEFRVVEAGIARP